MTYYAKHQPILFQAENNGESADVERLRAQAIHREGREVGYLEMKQMNEIMARYRARLRGQIKAYRTWHASYACEDDELERVYMALEGIYLRRQLADAYALYSGVNGDYHELLRKYMAGLGQPPHRRAVA